MPQSDEKKLDASNKPESLPSSLFIKIKPSDPKDSIILRKKLEKIPHRIKRRFPVMPCILCCFVLPLAILGIVFLILGTNAGVDPLMLLGGILCSALSIGGTYYTYKCTKDWVKLELKKPYSAILENDEKISVESKCNEWELNIKPESSTKEICNQLISRLKIEECFNIMEDPINSPISTHSILFARESPFRPIIWSYLFYDSEYTRENMSDKKEESRNELYIHYMTPV
jgi:hypothetical protein